MVADKQDQWFAELEKENNERLAQIEQAMLESIELHAIKAERVKNKAEAEERLRMTHPILSFIKRYSVIIIMLLCLCVTFAFNIFMFMR